MEKNYESDWDNVNWRKSANHQKGRQSCQNCLRQRNWRLLKAQTQA
jgi:hypothetical protein